MNADTMDGFGASRQRFDAICTVLEGEGAGGLEHSELEARLDRDGRELLRQLMQDHLDEGKLPTARLSAAVDQG